MSEINKRLTKKYIDVMSAYLEGKEIETLLGVGKHNIDEEWNTVETPLWDFTRASYRVKKEPLELSVVIGESGEVIGVYNSDTKSDYANLGAGYKVVRMVEAKPEV